MCLVGDQYLVIHDHNWPLNVLGHNPKVGSKHACIFDAVFAYDEHEMGQVFIFLFYQMIEMKGLDHHLLCPMEYWMNGVAIDKVYKCLATIPSEIMHAIKVVNLLDVTHPFIILLVITIVTSCFNVRKPAQKEYEYQYSLKRWKLHHGIHQALSLVGKSRVCSTTLDRLSFPTLQHGDNIYELCRIVWLWCCRYYGWWQLCHCAGNFVIILSLWIPQVNTMKIEHLVLTKKWDNSPKKALNMICHTQ